MSQKKRREKNYSDNFYSYYGGKDLKYILGLNFSQNPEQLELIRLMNENDKPIIFCFGDAGTGKTFTSIAAAIDLVKVKKKFSNIIYIREPIEVGKSLGFIPGDIDQKFGAYLGGLEDNLEHISSLTSLNINDMKSCIKTMPPQYIRGRSFEDCILLVDESQNMTLEEIHTISTRIGKYCKLVFLGSLKQIDLKGKTSEKNDFKTAYEILENGLPDAIGHVELIKSERSEYCKIIDDLFTQYKQKVQV